MRRFSIICIVALVCLSLSCDKSPNVQLEDYEISENKLPLSEKDIQACFSAMGLRYTRFSCMFPKRTGLTLSSIQYVNGQEHGGKSSVTTYIDKGKQDFILFMKVEGDQVKFTLASGPVSVGCGSASTESDHASSWGWLQPKEITQDKQPVFMYAANSEGIEGFSTPLTEDIETVVAKYDFAMVIYAAIANKETAHAGSMRPGCISVSE